MTYEEWKASFNDGYEAFCAQMEEESAPVYQEDEYLEWYEGADEPVTDDEARTMVLSVEENVGFMILFSDMPQEFYREAFIDALVGELVERVTLGRHCCAHVWGNSL